MKNVKKNSQITPKTDALMREIVNLMWDRVFEDKKNGVMKFKSNKKRVNETRNTT